MTGSTDYALLVSFPIQDEAFTLGVEAGIFWQRLSMGEREFEYLAHTKNLECLTRMVTAMDLQMRILTRDDEWMTLSIYPKPQEKDRPRLMLIDGGISLLTTKMAHVTDVVGKHEFFQKLSKLKMTPDWERHDFRNVPENALHTLASIFTNEAVFSVTTNVDFDLVQDVVKDAGLTKSEVYLSPIFPKGFKFNPKFLIIDMRKPPRSIRDPEEAIRGLIGQLQVIYPKGTTYIVLH